MYTSYQYILTLDRIQYPSPGVSQADEKTQQRRYNVLWKLTFQALRKSRAQVECKVKNFVHYRPTVRVVQCQTKSSPLVFVMSPVWLLD